MQVDATSNYLPERYTFTICLQPRLHDIKWRGLHGHEDHIRYMQHRKKAVKSLCCQLQRPSRTQHISESSVVASKRRSTTNIAAELKGRLEGVV